MTEISITKTQRDLMRHALGLSRRTKTAYRNHFVTGEGSVDHAHWMDLVAKGAARRHTGSPITGGSDVFYVTQIGVDAVMDFDEKLDVKVAK